MHSASSYNALVRALKQEVLEGHVKNPLDSSTMHDISRVRMHSENGPTHLNSSTLIHANKSKGITLRVS